MANNTNALDPKLQLKLDMSVPAFVEAGAVGKGLARTRWRPQLHRQLVLLPPDLKPLLPDQHFVFFLISTIRQFDLSGILVKYEHKAGTGRPAYDPVMMLTLILYCYCNGTSSARGIEKLCRENVPCRIITGNQTPDHDTIANYLAMHREQFDNIFQQTLELADQFGLVKLRHVAVDGSKIHANASKHKAMSYQRMCEKVEKLPQDIEKAQAQIKSLGEQADPLVAAEKFRKEIKFQKKRLTKIKKAKKRLERRAKAKAKAEAKETTPETGSQDSQNPRPS